MPFAKMSKTNRRTDILPNLVAVFIMILNYKSVTKYRHTRYSSLFRVTYADEMYLAAADAILAVNDQLEKQLREIKADHSGRLRLGISVQRSMQILPKVIPAFSAEVSQGHSGFDGTGFCQPGGAVAKGDH